MITTVLLGVIALLLLVGLAFFIKALETFAASHLAIQKQIETLQVATAKIAVAAEDLIKTEQGNNSHFLNVRRAKQIRSPTGP